jgi:hypothetical protein
MVTLRRFPFLNDIPIKANRAHSVVKGTIHVSPNEKLAM